MNGHLDALVISTGSHYAQLVNEIGPDSLTSMPAALRFNKLATAFCTCPVVRRLVRSALYRCGADTSEVDAVVHDCWMLLQSKYPRILVKSDDTLALARATAINFARQRSRAQRAEPETVSVSVIDGRDAVKEDFAAFGDYVQGLTEDAASGASSASMSAVELAPDYVSARATSQAQLALQSKLAQLGMPSGIRKPRTDHAPRSRREAPLPVPRRADASSKTNDNPDWVRLNRLRIISGMNFEELRIALGWNETHWNDVMTHRIGGKYSLEPHLTTRTNDLAVLCAQERSLVNPVQAQAFLEAEQMTGIQLLELWHGTLLKDTAITRDSCRRLQAILGSQVDLYRWISRAPSHGTRYAVHVIFQMQSTPGTSAMAMG